MAGFDRVEPVGGRGRYLLRLTMTADAPLLIPLQFLAEDGTLLDTVFVPKPDRVPLYLRLKHKTVSIACRSRDVASLSVGTIRKHDPRQLARLMPVSRQPLARVQGGINLSLFSVRPRSDFRQGMQALHELKALGLGLNPPGRNCSAAAVLGWEVDPLPSERMPSEASPRIAVLLTIEDATLWPEVEARLRGLPQSCKLFVTGREPDASLRKAVHRSHPSAEFVATSGGHIGSLFHVLYEGLLDEFELVCKLNAARRSRFPRQQIIDDVIRRLAFDSMIGSEGRIEAILRRFEEHPHLGMVGPAALAWPNETVNYSKAWGNAKKPTLELAARIGISQDRFRLDFFKGGTYWLRTQALDALRDLNLSSCNFETDDSDVLSSAVARLIKPGVERAGYFATGLSSGERDDRASRGVLQAPWSLQRSPGSMARRKLCLFVSFTPEGKFPPHALHHMKALKAYGISVLALAVIPSGRELTVRDPGVEFADGIACRANEGYDFAVWAAAMRRFPEIWDAEALLLVNDSVIGPLRPLDDIMARIEASDADVVGLTDCYQHKRHIQSYFLYLKRAALEAPALRRFWTNVRSQPDKFHLIKSYEVEMLSKLQTAGLRCAALFESDSSELEKAPNPTIHHWDELLARGFPFIKLQLLRDNPEGEDLSGWRARIDAHCDGAIVENFLAEAAPGSAALRVD